MKIGELINRLVMMVDPTREQEVVYLHSIEEDCNEYTVITDVVNYDGKIALLGTLTREELEYLAGEES